MDDKRIEKLEADLANFKKDFAEISKTLKELASEKSAEVQDRAKSAFAEAQRQTKGIFGQASDKGNEYYHHAREQFDDTIDKTKAQVQEHPLKAVAIVAGIGFLIGLLSKRH